MSTGASFLSNLGGDTKPAGWSDSDNEGERTPIKERLAKHADLSAASAADLSHAPSAAASRSVSIAQLHPAVSRHTSVAEALRPDDRDSDSDSISDDHSAADAGAAWPDESRLSTIAGRPTDCDFSPSGLSPALTPHRPRDIDAAGRVSPTVSPSTSHESFSQPASPSYDSGVPSAPFSRTSSAVTSPTSGSKATKGRGRGGTPVIQMTRAAQLRANAVAGRSGSTAPKPDKGGMGTKARSLSPGMAASKRPSAGPNGGAERPSGRSVSLTTDATAERRVADRRSATDSSAGAVKSSKATTKFSVPNLATASRAGRAPKGSPVSPTTAGNPTGQRRVSGRLSAQPSARPSARASAQVSARASAQVSAQASAQASRRESLSLQPLDDTVDPAADAPNHDLDANEEQEKSSDEGPDGEGASDLPLFDWSDLKLGSGNGGAANAVAAEPAAASVSAVSISDHGCGAADNAHPDGTAGSDAEGDGMPRDGSVDESTVFAFPPVATPRPGGLSVDRPSGLDVNPVTGQAMNPLAAPMSDVAHGASLERALSREQARAQEIEAAVTESDSFLKRLGSHSSGHGTTAGHSPLLDTSAPPVPPFFASASALPDDMSPGDVAPRESLATHRPSESVSRGASLEHGGLSPDCGHQGMGAAALSPSFTAGDPTMLGFRAVSATLSPDADVPAGNLSFADGGASVLEAGTREASPAARHPPVPTIGVLPALTVQRYVQSLLDLEASTRAAIGEEEFLDRVQMWRRHEHAMAEDAPDAADDSLSERSFPRAQRRYVKRFIDPEHREDLRVSHDGDLSDTSTDQGSGEEDEDKTAGARFAAAAFARGETAVYREQPRSASRQPHGPVPEDMLVASAAVPAPALPCEVDPSTSDPAMRVPSTCNTPRGGTSPGRRGSAAALIVAGLGGDERRHRGSVLLSDPGSRGPGSPLGSRRPSDVDHGVVHAAADDAPAGRASGVIDTWLEEAGEMLTPRVPAQERITPPGSNDNSPAEGPTGGTGQAQDAEDPEQPRPSDDSEWRNILLRRGRVLRRHGSDSDESLSDDLSSAGTPSSCEDAWWLSDAVMQSHHIAPSALMSDPSSVDISTATGPAVPSHRRGNSFAVLAAAQGHNPFGDVSSPAVDHRQVVGADASVEGADAVSDGSGAGGLAECGLRRDLGHGAGHESGWTPPGRVNLASVEPEEVHRERIARLSARVSEGRGASTARSVDDGDEAEDTFLREVRETLSGGTSSGPSSVRPLVPAIKNFNLAHTSTSAAAAHAQTAAAAAMSAAASSPAAARVLCGSFMRTPRGTTPRGASPGALFSLPGSQMNTSRTHLPPLAVGSARHHGPRINTARRSEPMGSMSPSRGISGMDTARSELYTERSGRWSAPSGPGTARDMAGMEGSMGRVLAQEFSPNATFNAGPHSRTVSGDRDAHGHSDGRRRYSGVSSASSRATEEGHDGHARGPDSPDVRDPMPQHSTPPLPSMDSTLGLGARPSDAVEYETSDVYDDDVLTQEGAGDDHRDGDHDEEEEAYVDPVPQHPLQGLMAQDQSTFLLDLSCIRGLNETDVSIDHAFGATPPPALDRPTMPHGSPTVNPLDLSAVRRATQPPTAAPQLTADDVLAMQYALYGFFAEEAAQRSRALARPERRERRHITQWARAERKVLRAAQRAKARADAAKESTTENEAVPVPEPLGLEALTAMALDGGGGWEAYVARLSALSITAEGEQLVQELCLTEVTARQEIDAERRAAFDAVQDEARDERAMARVHVAMVAAQDAVVAQEAAWRSRMEVLERDLFERHIASELQRAAADVAERRQQEASMQALLFRLQMVESAEAMARQTVAQDEASVVETDIFVPFSSGKGVINTKAMFAERRRHAAQRTECSAEENTLRQAVADEEETAFLEVIAAIEDEVSSLWQREVLAVTRDEAVTRTELTAEEDGALAGILVAECHWRATVSDESATRAGIAGDESTAFATFVSLRTEALVLECVVRPEMARRSDIATEAAAAAHDLYIEEATAMAEVTAACNSQALIDDVCNPEMEARVSITASESDVFNDVLHTESMAKVHCGEIAALLHDEAQARAVVDEENDAGIAGLAAQCADGAMAAVAAQSLREHTERDGVIAAETEGRVSIVSAFTASFDVIEADGAASHHDAVRSSARVVFFGEESMLRASIDDEQSAAFAAVLLASPASLEAATEARAVRESAEATAVAIETLEAAESAERSVLEEDFVVAVTSLESVVAAGSAAATEAQLLREQTEEAERAAAAFGEQCRELFSAEETVRAELSAEEVSLFGAVASSMEESEAEAVASQERREHAELLGKQLQECGEEEETVRSTIAASFDDSADELAKCFDEGRIAADTAAHAQVLEEEHLVEQEALVSAEKEQRPGITESEASAFTELSLAFESSAAAAAETEALRAQQQAHEERSIALTDSADAAMASCIADEATARGDLATAFMEEQTAAEAVITARIAKEAAERCAAREAAEGQEADARRSLTVAESTAATALAEDMSKSRSSANDAETARRSEEKTMERQAVESAEHEVRDDIAADELRSFDVIEELQEKHYASMAEAQRCRENEAILEQAMDMETAARAEVEAEAIASIDSLESDAAAAVLEIEAQVALRAELQDVEEQEATIRGITIVSSEANCFAMVVAAAAEESEAIAEATVEAEAEAEAARCIMSDLDAADQTPSHDAKEALGSDHDDHSSHDDESPLHAMDLSKVDAATPDVSRVDLTPFADIPMDSPTANDGSRTTDAGADLHAMVDADAKSSNADDSVSQRRRSSVLALAAQFESGDVDATPSAAKLRSLRADRELELRQSVATARDRFVETATHAVIDEEETARCALESEVAAALLDVARDLKAGAVAALIHSETNSRCALITVRESEAEDMRTDFVDQSCAIMEEALVAAVEDLELSEASARDTIVDDAMSASGALFDHHTQSVAFIAQQEALSVAAVDVLESDEVSARDGLSIEETTCFVVICDAAAASEVDIAEQCFVANVTALVTSEEEGRCALDEEHAAVMAETSDAEAVAVAAAEAQQKAREAAVEEALIETVRALCQDESEVREDIGQCEQNGHAVVMDGFVAEGRALAHAEQEAISAALEELELEEACCRAAVTDDALDSGIEVTSQANAVLAAAASLCECRDIEARERLVLSDEQASEFHLFADAHREGMTATLIASLVSAEGEGRACIDQAMQALYDNIVSAESDALEAVLDAQRCRAVMEEAALIACLCSEEQSVRDGLLLAASDGLVSLTDAASAFVECRWLMETATLVACLCAEESAVRDDISDSMDAKFGSISAEVSKDRSMVQLSAELQSLSAAESSQREVLHTECGEALGDLDVVRAEDHAALVQREMESVTEEASSLEAPPAASAEEEGEDSAEAHQADNGDDSSPSRAAVEAVAWRSFVAAEQQSSDAESAGFARDREDEEEEEQQRLLELRRATAAISTMLDDELSARSALCSAASARMAVLRTTLDATVEHQASKDAEAAAAAEAAAEATAAAEAARQAAVAALHQAVDACEVEESDARCALSGDVATRWGDFSRLAANARATAEAMHAAALAEADDHGDSDEWEDDGHCEILDDGEARGAQGDGSTDEEWEDATCDDAATEEAEEEEGPEDDHDRVEEDSVEEKKAINHDSLQQAAVEDEAEWTDAYSDVDGSGTLTAVVHDEHSHTEEVDCREEGGHDAEEDSDDLQECLQGLIEIEALHRDEIEEDWSYDTVDLFAQMPTPAPCPVAFFDETCMELHDTPQHEVGASPAPVPPQLGRPVAYDDTDDGWETDDIDSRGVSNEVHHQDDQVPPAEADHTPARGDSHPAVDDAASNQRLKPTLGRPVESDTDSWETDGSDESADASTPRGHDRDDVPVPDAEGRGISADVVDQAVVEEEEEEREEEVEEAQAPKQPSPPLPAAPFSFGQAPTTFSVSPFSAATAAVPTTSAGGFGAATGFGAAAGFGAVGGFGATPGFAPMGTTATPAFGGAAPALSPGPLQRVDVSGDSPVPVAPTSSQPPWTFTASQPTPPIVPAPTTTAISGDRSDAVEASPAAAAAHDNTATDDSDMLRSPSPMTQHSAWTPQPTLSPQETAAPSGPQQPHGARTTPGDVGTTVVCSPLSDEGQPSPIPAAPAADVSVFVSPNPFTSGVLAASPQPVPAVSAPAVSNMDPRFVELCRGEGQRRAQLLADHHASWTQLRRALQSTIAATAAGHTQTAVVPPVSSFSTTPPLCPPSTGHSAASAPAPPAPQAPLFGKAPAAFGAQPFTPNLPAAPLAAAVNATPSLQSATCVPALGTAHVANLGNSDSASRSAQGAGTLAAHGPPLQRVHAAYRGAGSGRSKLPTRTRLSARKDAAPKTTPGPSGNVTPRQLAYDTATPSLSATPAPQSGSYPPSALNTARPDVGGLNDTHMVESPPLSRTFHSCISATPASTFRPMGPMGSTGQPVAPTGLGRALQLTVPTSAVSGGALRGRREAFVPIPAFSVYGAAHGSHSTTTSPAVSRAVSPASTPAPDRVLDYDAPDTVPGTSTTAHGISAHSRGPRHSLTDVTRQSRAEAEHRRAHGSAFHLQRRMSAMSDGGLSSRASAASVPHSTGGATLRTPDVNAHVAPPGPPAWGDAHADVVNCFTDAATPGALGAPISLGSLAGSPAGRRSAGGGRWNGSSPAALERWVAGHE